MGYRDRHDQEARHRGENREAHRALLGIYHAGQPRVSDPGPPQNAEDQDPLRQAGPGGMRGHQSGALGDRQHEDEVEEQLEGRDALALPAHRREPRGARSRRRWHQRPLGEAMSALVGLGGGRLEDAQELDHPAHEQALLVDLDPNPGGGGKHHVVTGLHRHLDPGLLPPVEPGADGEHDPLLGRRVVGPGRYDEPGPAHPVLIELLDHHLIEQRPKVVANRLNGLPFGPRIHAAEDNRALVPHSPDICHTQVLFNDGTQGKLPGMPDRDAAPSRAPSPAENASSTARRDKLHSRADIEVARRAAGEGGVLGLDELRACGLSRNAIGRRVRNGWLHPIYQGVYAVGHPAVPIRARFLAAVKSVPRGAVLSHFSGAAHWEYVEWDGRHVEVTVVATGFRSREGIRVHCSSVLERRDVMRHRGIPVTSPARTLVDLAAVVNEAMLRTAVRRALGMRRVSIRQLVAARRRLGPRRGSARFDRVLRTAAPTRSELEDVVLDLIGDAGFARPEVNRPLLLAGRRVIPDFRWPEQRLVVEADGAAWHDNPVARAEDAERQALLEARGDRVLRVTWAQAVSRPGETLARIRAAGAPPLSPPGAAFPRTRGARRPRPH